MLILMLGCSTLKSKRGKEIHKDVPKSAFEVFNNFQCNRCHKLPPTDFTDYGKDILSKGYGCISLQTLAKQHKLSGEARRIFVESGCVECHDINGNGFGKANLNEFGLKVQDKDLGCVGTFKRLLGED